MWNFRIDPSRSSLWKCRTPSAVLSEILAGVLFPQRSFRSVWKDSLGVSSGNLPEVHLVIPLGAHEEIPRSNSRIADLAAVGASLEVSEEFPEEIHKKNGRIH